MVHAFAITSHFLIQAVIEVHLPDGRDWKVELASIVPPLVAEPWGTGGVMLRMTMRVEKAGITSQEKGAKIIVALEEIHRIGGNALMIAGVTIGLPGTKIVTRVQNFDAVCSLVLDQPNDGMCTTRYYVLIALAGGSLLDDGGIERQRPEGPETRFHDSLGVDKESSRHAPRTAVTVNQQRLEQKLDQQEKAQGQKEDVPSKRSVPSSRPLTCVRKLQHHDLPHTSLVVSIVVEFLDRSRVPRRCSSIMTALKAQYFAAENRQEIC
ncbi:hypothetical protein F5146DRAFT_1000186 [Armillaria mellea]|nr:hypothetical protein F5146DRAFT_1000186 [Armillaria mellea]